MEFTAISNQVLVLFILLVIGFILRKFDLMNDELNKGLSNLIIYVTLPALIITSMNYEFSQDKLNNSIKLLIIGFFIYIFMILLSLLYTKIFHIEEPQRGVYQFLIIFANVGFMGYPIVEVIFGKIGVFYAAIYNLWFNIILWTLGIILINPKHDKNINFKNLINPGTVSLLIGFIIFIFSIKLPQPIYVSLDRLGASTTPMAMLVVGSLLGDAKIGEIFTNKHLIITTLIRLIIIPAILIMGLSLFKLPDVVKGIPVVIGSMPAAANMAIFARKFNSDYRLASQGVFFTTLVSIGTIPLVIFMLLNF
ncbi:AEC family transporter [Thermohalobacter berrensis]|uniref:Transporter n=1 Tax=Thermohalobacter berrensis TaxID=99594 RepID=A0A419T499_9FIRM|nr:AEC family transporter [Thermohalobacter berrensis]RKD32243.1 transporter [Thermohalobacter berrensis]